MPTAPNNWAGGWKTPRFLRSREILVSRPKTCCRLFRPSCWSAAGRSQGDSAVLADILRRIPGKDYDHGDAWVLGRLRAGAADSVAARFRAADTEEFRVRYLTLLSYFTDPQLIPLLARIYAAPDSFRVPKRYAIRASDGLLWIGTKESLQALLDARAAARGRGIYADSSLARGGYDFLADDSSAVISRTGQWLTDWVKQLRAGR